MSRSRWLPHSRSSVRKTGFSFVSNQSFENSLVNSFVHTWCAFSLRDRRRSASPDESTTYSSRASASTQPAPDCSERRPTAAMASSRLPVSPSGSYASSDAVPASSAIVASSAGAASTSICEASASRTSAAGGPPTSPVSRSSGVGRYFASSEKRKTIAQVKNGGKGNKTSVCK